MSDWVVSFLYVTFVDLHRVRKLGPLRRDDELLWQLLYENVVLQ